MLSAAAKNLNIKTLIISDDKDAPGKFFADEFIFCKYDDDLKIEEFCSKVDFVTFEFENIPYETETFIDSSDWVMTPNVYGMGLFSDGGIFATKPYLCGSNYLLKMSNYSRGEWTQTMDGLYWTCAASSANCLYI